MTLSKCNNLSEPLLVLIPGVCESPWPAVARATSPSSFGSRSPSGEREADVGWGSLSWPKGPREQPSLLPCVRIPTKQALAPYDSSPVRPRILWRTQSFWEADLGLSF